MRKQNKIVSLVLVVALLLSMLVIPSFADETSGQAEPPTPTANWALTTNGNELYSATKGTEEGNILTYLALNKTDEFNMYVITTAGDDSFANLVPKIDGKPTKDFQFTYAAGSNPAFTADAGNYYVVEFDLASESAFSESLYVQPLMRDANGGGYPFADKFYPYSHVEADGEWHHVVAIGDMGNNKIYYFVDGALAQTGVAYNKSYEVGMFNAVKVSNDVDTDYAYSTAQSNAIGNMSARIYTSANTDAVAALAAAIANEDVSDVATSAKTGYPALATVDGVEYSSVNGVNAALNSPLPVKVELLRQFAGTITVNCDATVETNGFAGNVEAGEGVDVSNEGTVYTYDAPFMTIAPFAETKDLATIMAAIKSGVAGNDWADIEPNGVNGTTSSGKTGITIGLTTDYTTGNQYLDVKPGEAESGSYFGVKPETWAGVRVYKGDENQYYVLDMDIAFYGNVSTAFGWFAVCRQNGGLFGASVSSGNFNASVNALEKGKFHHFTTILDFDNNKAYTFANGVLISTVNNGVYGGSGAALYAADAGIMFEQLRLFQSNVDYFAVDNVSIRKATDVSSTAAALSAGSLDNWNDKITNDAGYVAPVAKVDGEYVYSAAALTDALSGGRQAKTVEFVRDVVGTVTVNCDATVETNGVAVNVVAGEDVDVSNEGTVYTYDAPWRSSVTESTATSANFIIDTSVEGNLYAPYAINANIKLNNNGSNEMAMYQVTDVDTGNTYLKLQPTKTCNTSANIYLNEIIGSATAGDTSADTVLLNGQGYYVYDFDIATDSRVLENMSFRHIATNNASEGGAWPYGEFVYFKDYEYTSGEWNHVTIVGDLAANKQYVFVNGALAGEAGYANQENNKHAALNIKGARINLAPGAAIDENETILLDNFSVRAYKTVDAAGGLGDAITAHSLAGWTYNVDNNNGKLPSIANVNGTEYSSVDTLTAALSDGKNLEVSLDRAVAGTAFMSTTGTVVTNNLANFIVGANGYRLEDNGDGTYTSSKTEDRMGTITVNINGNAAITAYVLYGTDIVEYLTRNNSYAVTALTGDDRTVYYNAVWDTIPSGTVYEANSEVVYSVTADKFTGNALVLDSSGNYKSGVDVYTALRNETYKTVILNKDCDLNRTGMGLVGVKNVFLNGYAMFSTATGSHVFTPTLTADVKFVNGSIVDYYRNNTHSLFFFMCGSTATVEFIDCYMASTSNLLELQEGHARFENCVIDSLKTFHNAHFTLGTYHSSSTDDEISLEFYNTVINVTNHRGTGNSIPLIHVNGTSSATSAYTGDKDAVNALNLNHRIVFSGCTVGLNYNDKLITSTADTDGTFNYTVSIDNTELNVKNIGDNLQNVVIGENVVSAITLNGCVLGSGIVEVNSGVATAPFAYTANYATVIWSDGSEQKWADGTYPVKEGVSDNVCKVEAGQTYNFEEADVNLSVKVNLTLDATLTLNVYVQEGAGVTSVNIGGVEIAIDSADSVTIGGAAYKQFKYDVLPHRAAGDIIIAITTGADTTVTKTLSLVDYATRVYASYSGTNARQLVANLLNYVLEAHEFKGVYAPGVNDITTFLAENEADVVAPSVPVNTMPNVSDYFESAQLNLASAPKWRFNVKDGADITGLVIVVDGKQVAYEIGNGYVEFELAAYDMLDTVTVTVGGAEGTYNLAAYYEAQNTYATQNGTDWSNTNVAGDDAKGAMAYATLNLIKALYSYAHYAAAYNA